MVPLAMTAPGSIELDEPVAGRGASGCLGQVFKVCVVEDDNVAVEGLILIAAV